MARLLETHQVADESVTTASENTSGCQRQYNNLKDGYCGKNFISASQQSWDNRDIANN